jgi:ElaB/YqjD/DUF883 family membrane-anchored ribosome-binding protein
MFMQTDETNKMGQTMDNMTNRVQESLDQGRRKISDLGQNVAGLTKDYARYTDEYVHENSWKAVGFAAVLGLAVGLLISRR